MIDCLEIKKQSIMLWFVSNNLHAFQIIKPGS